MHASFIPSPPLIPRESSIHAPQSSSAQLPARFSPFSCELLPLAAKRGVPLFLIIGDIDEAFGDPSIQAHLTQRTVAAHLLPGLRPDIELLCRRAALLYSGEDTLPLCALLLPNGLPFLAASLPPHGFPADPSRLFVWLTHADRRFMQNRAAFSSQASMVLRSFQASALAKPYSPRDAAHDLLRAALSAEDTVNGGFGRIKAPHIPLLSFLSAERLNADHRAHTALSAALRAMQTSALCDPVDGLFFRSTLTEDWRIFVPEKTLVSNVCLAMVLLKNGQRADAVGLLNTVVSRFSLPGGGFSPALRAPRSLYSFTPQQVTAALGDEDGLRACRLLGLLHNRRSSDPPVSPSRFSPPARKQSQRKALDEPTHPLCPQFSSNLAPEDEAFLRRVLPVLARTRAARMSEQPAAPMLTMDCAFAAAILARCAARLGESKYIQAAQRAVHALLLLIPDPERPGSLAPTGDRHTYSPPICGASAALSLALLTLGQEEPDGAYAQIGLRLLGSALHAFVREDGMVMHTAQDARTAPVRVPAIYDDESPSPAALLIYSLQAAQALRPNIPYHEAIMSIWHAAAPYIRHEPFSCASLIEAMQETAVQ